MDSDLVLVIVVVTALAFDFTNGFHDTANVVATGDLDPRDPAADRRRLGAAVLNFVGAFISLEVAATVAKGIVQADLITPTIVFARPDRRDRVEPDHVVVRAALELVARADRRRGRARRSWPRGRRRSISGGLVGKVIVPALIAPTLAFVVAALSILCAYWIIGRLRPGSGEPRLPARADRLGRAARARRTAPTTRRRRWGSSRSR